MRHLHPLPARRFSQPATSRTAAGNARYHARRSNAPAVYWRLTDNWLELTVRFLVPEHGIRNVKDQMSRAILPKLEEKKIEIARAAYETVGRPGLRMRLMEGSAVRGQASGPSSQEIS